VSGPLLPDHVCHTRDKHTLTGQHQRRWLCIALLFSGLIFLAMEKGMSGMTAPTLPISVCCKWHFVVNTRSSIVKLRMCRTLLAACFAAALIIFQILSTQLTTNGTDATAPTPAP
jgi:hypothetical protein